MSYLSKDRSKQLAEKQVRLL